MKILYVEDELPQNIPRIIQLFGEYLGEERIRTLETLENDESGYGASPDEIKKVVEDTGVVDVEYRFPEALNQVISHYHQYDMFIIDRNLIESKYTAEEIRKVVPDYDRQVDRAYTEREGDYLFLKLGLCSQGKALDKVRILTAYPNQNEFCKNPKIALLFDRWHVSMKDFIEKGDYNAIKALRDEIINLPPQSAIQERQP
jgi:hypothetical protein